MATKVNKKSEKAIIWGRVSTVYQEITAQVNEMIEQAVRDGYKRENLIVIKSKGASARKQNDLYKKEVAELLETLSNDPTIKCVYVWEVSRLARVELPFYRMKEYFTTNKVQLIVKTPAIKLLDDEGNVDLSQEVILNLLVTLAKQEMEIKEKRFARGRAEAQKQGKFSGGQMMFGYTVDAENRIIVNEEEAQIVRQIFDLYLTTDMSARQIYHYLRERGAFQDANLSFAGAETNKVLKVLKNYSYCGETSTYTVKGENGREKREVKTQYPAIVTRETMDRAIAKIKSRAKAPKNSKNIYFGKSLLFCNECGHRFRAVRNNAVYVCSEWGHHYSINMNAVDTAIWHCAQIYNDFYMTSKVSENRAIYTAKMRDNEQVIETLKSDLASLDKQLERLNDLYIDGRITREKVNAKSEEIEDEIKKTNAKIAQLQENNVRLKSLLGTLSVGQMPPLRGVNYQPPTDDAERRAIIDTVIERVEVERLEKSHYRLKIYDKMHCYPEDPIVYETTTIKGNQVVLQVYMKDVAMELTIEKRFKPLNQKKKSE